MRIQSPKPDLWECRYLKGKNPWLIVVDLQNRTVHVHDGPENPTARSHEGMGGTQSFESFIKSPAPWTKDFPDLTRMVRRAVQQKL